MKKIIFFLIIFLLSSCKFSNENLNYLPAVYREVSSTEIKKRELILQKDKTFTIRSVEENALPIIFSGTYEVILKKMSHQKSSVKQSGIINLDFNGSQSKCEFEWQSFGDNTNIRISLLLRSISKDENFAKYISINRLDTIKYEGWALI